MRGKTRVFIITAAALIVAGIVISAAAVGMGALDERRGGSKMAYQEKTYTYSTSALKGLDVSDVSSDIVVKGWSDSQAKIVCFENERDYYDINMSSDGRLSVNRRISRSWFNFFSFERLTRKNVLTIYVPSNIEGDLKISSTSGGISLSEANISGTLTASNVSGSVQLSSVSAKGKCSLSNVSGNAEIKKLVTASALSLKTTSGNLRLIDSSVLGELSSTNTSGSTELLNTNVTGDVNAGGVSGDLRIEALTGGNFTLKSTSGSIKGYITGNPAEYRIEASSTSGRLNLPRSQNGTKLLKVSTVSGGVDLDIR